MMVAEKHQWSFNFGVFFLVLILTGAYMWSLNELGIVKGKVRINMENIQYNNRMNLQGLDDHQMILERLDSLCSP